MYFSIFSSYEFYYFNEDSDTDLPINTDKDKNKDEDNDKDDICIVCWFPGDINELKQLSQFSYFKPKCECKPKIHKLCMDEWIKKNPSCPICRTKMNVIVFSSNSNSNNIFINCYIIFVEYTVYLFKIICYASFLNLLCIIIYNLYFIYFIKYTTYQDNYMEYNL